MEFGDDPLGLLIFQGYMWDIIFIYLRNFSFHLQKNILNKKWMFCIFLDTCSNVSRIFLGRPIHTLNPWRCHHGWCRAEKFSKFVLPDTLKMHSLKIKNLYGYKLVRDARRSEFKRCSKSYRRNHTKQCKLFR